jgi:hypothetical protein
MGRSVFAFAGLSILAASALHAQDNVNMSTLRQIGGHNSAELLQLGQNNTSMSVIEQIGGDALSLNQTVVLQAGHEATNSSSIVQMGGVEASNVLLLQQTGHLNKNTSTIHQTGGSYYSYQTATVRQMGERNENSSVVNEIDGTHGIILTQQGLRTVNKSEVTQQGSVGTYLAEVAQGGTENINHALAEHGAFASGGAAARLLQ